MAAKYKEFFNLMLAQNKELFENFKDIHDHYTLEPEKYQKVFNDYGKEILDVVQEWKKPALFKSRGQRLWKIYIKSFGEISPGSQKISA